jgi:zinc/manganese transport system substrate-binding protein
MTDLTHAIVVALNDISPDPERADRERELNDEIRGLLERLVAIGLDHLLEGVIVTEPVPLYLVHNAGLKNLTPPEFTEAIEQDTDVAPALLQQVLDLVPDASVVIVNGQTGGPQTDAVIAAAEAADVPWFEVTETMPEGVGYVEWQAGILDLLEQSLAS